MSAMRLLLVAYLALKTAHAQVKRKSYPTCANIVSVLAGTGSHTFCFFFFPAATLINIFTSSTVCTKLSVLLLFFVAAVRFRFFSAMRNN